MRDATSKAKYLNNEIINTLYSNKFFLKKEQSKIDAIKHLYNTVIYSYEPYQTPLYRLLMIDCLKIIYDACDRYGLISYYAEWVHNDANRPLICLARRSDRYNYLTY